MSRANASKSAAGESRRVRLRLHWSVVVLSVVILAVIGLPVRGDEPAKKDGPPGSPGGPGDTPDKQLVLAKAEQLVERTLEVLGEREIDDQRRTAMRDAATVCVIAKTYGLLVGPPPPRFSKLRIVNDSDKAVEVGIDGFLSKDDATTIDEDKDEFGAPYVSVAAGQTTELVFTEEPVGMTRIKVRVKMAGVGEAEIPPIEAGQYFVLAASRHGAFFGEDGPDGPHPAPIVHIEGASGGPYMATLRAFEKWDDSKPSAQGNEHLEGPVEIR